MARRDEPIVRRWLTAARGHAKQLQVATPRPQPRLVLEAA